MKRLVYGILVAAVALVPGTAQAQITIGPELAYEPDLDLGIGASLGTQLASLGSEFGLLADFLIFFPDVGNYFEFNGNVTYDFPLDNSTIVPYLLGGLNLGRSSVGSVSSTDLRLNLGGGIDFDAGNFRPTVGVRAAIGEGDPLVFFVTLPFQTGG